MATNRKNTRTKKEFKPVDLGDGWILHYRENEYGLFGLEHNDATIYGCKLIEGSQGIFVSYPSRKGTDGKYYAHARFAKIPDAIVEAIADAIGF